MGHGIDGRRRRAGLAWLVTGLAVALAAAPARAERPPFRILHVMSYHSPWRWTDGQLQGFKDALQGVPVEYRVVQLDTKRRSAPEERERAGAEARAVVGEWKPDLLYTSDDDAQEYVARYYVGTPLPIVFSGVNKDPAVYGFTGSKNVSGVLEQEHFAESVQLLRQLVPGVRRIAVVLDDDTMWEPVAARMRAAAARLPGLELGPWDVIRTFEEYQRKMRGYAGRVDAVALIGVFRFRGADGANVPYQEVLRWTAENVRLPDLSLWLDRVHFGTLAAVTVSEREQGLAAGRIARGILVDGRAPSSFPMTPTTRGLPVVSLARARRLGLTPSTTVLLSSEVITDFQWER